MKTIDDLALSGRRVLVRLDLNVPLDRGEVTDDGKIRASLPTLSALLHRGRPWWSARIWAARAERPIRRTRWPRCARS